MLRSSSYAGDGLGFPLYVQDGADGPDRLWIVTRDPSGTPFDDLSMAAGPRTSAVPLTGGETVVPRNQPSSEVARHPTSPSTCPGTTRTTPRRR